MTLRRSSVRSLCRAGAAALIAGAAVLAGAPAAVADEAPPVVALLDGSSPGHVVDGDPLTGASATTLVQADAALARNSDLNADTGWVDDVRGASAGSTKAVAGGAMLVVAGLISVVAVAPRRRPPTDR